MAIELNSKAELNVMVQFQDRKKKKSLVDLGGLLLSL